jgi:hypothetical protein
MKFQYQNKIRTTLQKMSSFSTERLGCEPNTTKNRNLSTEMDSASSSDSNKIVFKNSKKKSSRALAYGKKKSKKTFQKKSLGQEIILRPKRKKEKELEIIKMSRNVQKKEAARPKPLAKKSQTVKIRKKVKKFWKTVEKMHLKTYKTIVIGIGYDLFRCTIARISDNSVHLYLEGRDYSSVQDADQYTLKNLKIMMEQGVYLTSRSARIRQKKIRCVT